jgi:hypothetical protein
MEVVGRIIFVSAKKFNQFMLFKTLNWAKYIKEELYCRYYHFSREKEATYQ